MPFIIFLLALFVGMTFLKDYNFAAFKVQSTEPSPLQQFRTVNFFLIQFRSCGKKDT